jgi:hypothetical protein
LGLGSNFTPKPLTKLSFYLSVFVICHALPVYVSSHDLSSY